MKRIHFIFPAFVLFIALTAAFQQDSDMCDSKTLKDDAKKALDPFKYDSGKLTRIYYRKKAQVKEVEIPVFVGEKYRMVFNTTSVTRGLVIHIYNKDKDAKNRKELFSITCPVSGDKITHFDPDGAKFKYYLDYDIPATNDSLPAPECVVFMLGYK